jgi:hypothetical protein
MFEGFFFSRFYWEGQPMKSQMLIFIVFFCHFLKAETEFYISELFINTSKSKELQGQWIELHNVSLRKIKINHALVEVFDAHNTRHSQAEIDLIEPVFLEDRLLLAQKHDLGLGHCLEKHLNILVLPGINMAPNKAQKICITLNHELKDCALLSAKQKSAVGISLYRNGTIPLWLHEPCELLPNIFATPGLSEQACLYDENFASDILCSNTASNHYKVQIKILEKSKAERPKLMTRQEGPLSFISVSDADPADLWRLDQCVAPLNSRLICRETNPPVSFNDFKERPLKLWDNDNLFLPRRFLKIRDLFGHVDQSSLGETINKNKSFMDIIIDMQKVDDDKLLITVDIPHELVPINYWLKNKLGVLANGAWLSAGKKEIKINRHQEYDVKFLLKNRKETVEFKLLHHSNSLGCSAQDVDLGCEFILINIILTSFRLVLIKRKRRK